MGLLTQDPYIHKEHTELYKFVKFRVNWANIEQDTAIQNRRNLLRKDKCPAIHTFFSNICPAVEMKNIRKGTREAEKA